MNEYLLWVKWQYEEGACESCLSIQALDVEEALQKAAARYVESNPRDKKWKYYEDAHLYMRVVGLPERYFLVRDSRSIKELFVEGECAV